MTEEVQVAEQKPTDKELNFRQLEAKYERKLAEERTAREEAIRELQRLKTQDPVEEDDDSEPFVDHKKLNKRLAKFGEQVDKVTETKIQNAVKNAIEEQKKQSWVENNPDFYDTLTQHAEKLASAAPKLAESILRMPDGFERQQLVYNNIKALGLDKPAAKASSIQDKIDANRRSPYYQPSGVAPAPYGNSGDFSAVGQKSAYEKMQELKRRIAGS